MSYCWPRRMCRWSFKLLTSTWLSCNYCKHQGTVSVNGRFVSFPPCCPSKQVNNSLMFRAILWKKNSNSFYIICITLHFLMTLFQRWKLISYALCQWCSDSPARILWKEFTCGFSVWNSSGLSPCILMAVRFVTVPKDFKPLHSIVQIHNQCFQLYLGTKCLPAKQE